MHVTPSELPIVRRDGVAVRFAVMGSMAFVLAELPRSGSSGTSMEVPCAKPHWAFVVSGEVEFASQGRVQRILPGSAFHVIPGGPPHTFHADGPAWIAGFEPIDAGVDISESTLTAQGFEVIPQGAPVEPLVVPATIAPVLDRGHIQARSWRMSNLILTEARFGPKSGFTAGWCDVPHWGMVSDGSLVMEFEDEMEILGTGDVFHCPGGPPGHRLEAADPASIVDLSPLANLESSRRIAPWRKRIPEEAEQLEADPIAVAGLG
jgi:quercetin dioxygenase-like cupin family protein